MTTPLGELVKTRRKDLNMTQEELADKVGMSQRWVSNLETGGVKRSRIDTLQQLSVALSLPLDDLVIAAGMAESVSAARRVVANYTDTVVGYDVARDDPRIPLLELLEGKDREEVESITLIVRTLMERTEEVFRRPISSGAEKDSSNRRRTA